MTKPITPEQATAAKKAALPDEVIEAFNELIAESWNGYSAIVIQDEAARRIAAKMECEVSTVFRRHWLDVEKIYEEAGWEVEFDRPGWCESGEATFKFTRKK